MCGRYHLSPGHNFFTRFKIQREIEGIKENFNVAPGMYMPVVYNEKFNQVDLMRWGLIPSWAKDPKIGYRMINARAETVAEKPSFRKSLQSQRCLIPASGFFEWQRDGKGKIPFYFHRRDSKLFSFAGLYDHWRDAEGQILKTFTIITTKPNKIVEPIHDRMPVILPERGEKIWLDRELQDQSALLDLLEPLPARELEAYQVGKKVNNPKNNLATIIKPIE